MSKSAEQALAIGLLSGAFGIYAFRLFFRQALTKRKQLIGEPMVAAVMAYTCYVAAALLAGAKFPEFLREHLFDGLAPAAAVGLLINSIPRDDPRTALPQIRRPVVVLVVVAAGGALIFGLIAAAAVFASGSDNFGGPVGWCAFYGAAAFGYGYGAGVSVDFMNDRLVVQYRPMIIWFFTKRPQRAATPDPDGPEDTSTPAHEDAAEDGPVSGAS